jgi:hypothetical protein
MPQFDIAFGYCTVRDGALVIERTDPEEMGRWEVFREGLGMNLAYRPWATVVYLGVVLCLGVVFVALLLSLYASNPAVAPLVGGLGFFGLTVVGGSLELGYRRGIRARRRLQNTLADEFAVAYPDRIPLDEITGVTVRSVSTGLFFSDGRLFLVHFHRGQKEQTTPLGFPEFMSEERSAARRLFEDHGIAFTDDE